MNKVKNMDEVYELYENCTTENTIMCSKCRTIGTEMNCDPYDAAVIWNKKGWRITRHQTIYCPKCAEGKLKPKK